MYMPTAVMIDELLFIADHVSCCGLQRQGARHEVSVLVLVGVRLWSASSFRFEPTSVKCGQWLCEICRGMLKTWADFIVASLPDPGDQLCTDDFEGASPHNINLAAKVH